MVKSKTTKRRVVIIAAVVIGTAAIGFLIWYIFLKNPKPKTNPELPAVTPENPYQSPPRTTSATASDKTAPLYQGVSGKTAEVKILQSALNRILTRYSGTTYCGGCNISQLSVDGLFGQKTGKVLYAATGKWTASVAEVEAAEMFVDFFAFDRRRREQGL